MLKEITKNSHKPGRKAKPINTDDLRVARLLVAVTHNKLGSWDAVASYYGISKAAAHRIAHDKTYRPSQTTIDKVLAAQPSKPSPLGALALFVGSTAGVTVQRSPRIQPAI